MHVWMFFKNSQLFSCINSLYVLNLASNDREHFVEMFGVLNLCLGRMFQIFVVTLLLPLGQ